jgi:ATP-dependent Clp protease, protease subunit
MQKYIGDKYMSSLEQTTVKHFDTFNAEDRIAVRLLENSVFFLIGDITEENVADCIRWIAYENLTDSNDKLLTLYVNTFGGDLYQAFALVDMMRNSRYPIRTIGIGAVMSAGFLIFASGTQGERIVARNTGLMCHQYSEEVEGKHHDLKASLKEGVNCNRRMMEILVNATGLTPARVRAKLLKETDVFLTAKQAIDVGVADHIL